MWILVILIVVMLGAIVDDNAPIFGISFVLAVFVAFYEFVLIY